MIKYRILHTANNFYPYKVQWKFKYFPFWFPISGFNGFFSFKSAQESIKRKTVTTIKVWEGTPEDI